MSSIRAKSKSIASDVLSKRFKPEKCKTALKMAVARMKLLRNKREAQIKQMRRDLAQLLDSGQEQTARIRVEHVIREEKTLSAYDLIELYCELIVVRLPIIGSQKNCPVDLKEAIASVVFASPRCADVPELTDIRKHFTAKYGKEFIDSALEVRPDCGVSRMVVEKLSARAPDVETKIKILTAIAQEHNVQWDPKAFEELQKPKEDLLDGRNTFASNNNILKEPSNVKLTPEPSQKNEAANKKSENDVSTLTSFNAFHRSTNTPITPQSELGLSENVPRNREDEYSYSRRENDSLNHSNWNMEFKDATSAAQAASEAAERASMAARAAAELASCGNVSGPYPVGSHESPTYTRDKEPVESISSKPKVEHVIDQAVAFKHNEQKHPQEVKQVHMDELMRPGFKGAPESTNDACEDVRSGSSTRSPSLSSEASAHDDTSEFNLRKADEMAYGPAQSFSTADHMEQTTTSKNQENDEFDQKTMNENDSKSDFFFSKGKFDKDAIWDSNFQKTEDADGQNSATGSGRMDSSSSHKEPSFGRNSAVVFDDYGSDTDDHFTYGRYSEGNLLNSFPSHQGNESSTMPPNVDCWSLKQQRSGSLTKDVTSELSLVTEANHKQNFGTSKVVDPSCSNDNLPVAFDDSGGLDSQSENEMGKEAVESDSSIHAQRGFTRGSLSAEGGHSLTGTSLEGMNEVEQAKEGSSSLVFSNNHGEDYDAELSYGDKSWERYGSHGLTDNQLSSRKEELSPHSSGRGVFYHSKGEGLPSPGASKVSSIEKEETEAKFEIPLSPSSSRDSELLNDYSYENGQALNLGRLTGGIRNRGVKHPPFLRSPLVDASFSPKQSSIDAPPISNKPSVSSLGKSSGNSEIPDEEKYDQESTSKSILSSQRTSRAYIDSKFKETEGLESQRTSGSIGFSDGASLSANKAAEDAPSITKNLSLLQEYRISGNQDILVEESSSQRLRRKDHTPYSSETSIMYSDSESNEQHSRAGGSTDYRDNASSSPIKSTNSSSTIEKLTVTHQNRMSATSEVSKQVMIDKTPRAKAYKEPSKMHTTYMDIESDGEVELESRRIIGSRGSRDVKLSRRTRGLLSETKKGHRSELRDQPNVPSISELESKPSHTSSSAHESLSRTLQAIKLEGNESKNLGPRSPAQDLSVMPSKTESPKSSQIESKQCLTTETGNPTTSSLSGGSTSSENTSKSASHVHPKLPDYDSLASHFQFLRSNR